MASELLTSVSTLVKGFQDKVESQEKPQEFKKLDQIESNLEILEKKQKSLADEVDANINAGLRASLE